MSKLEKFHRCSLTPINGNVPTGGKPSTWFPPGELVEQSNQIIQQRAEDSLRRVLAKVTQKASVLKCILRNHMNTVDSKDVLTSIKQITANLKRTLAQARQSAAVLKRVLPQVLQKFF